MMALDYTTFSRCWYWTRCILFLAWPNVFRPLVVRLCQGLIEKFKQKIMKSLKTLPYKFVKMICFRLSKVIYQFRCFISDKIHGFINLDVKSNKSSWYILFRFWDVVLVIIKNVKGTLLYLVYIINIMFVYFKGIKYY